MKKLQKLPLLLTLFSLIMTACKKDKKDDSTTTGPLGPNYPQVINTIVTPAIIDTLKKQGMVINDGLTPPNINGIFLFSPAYCTFDNSGGNGKGYTFDDYKLQFKDQNTNQYTVNLKYKDVSNGQDNASDGTATYISGQNNLFTVFAQAKGTASGINYVALDVISGQAQGTALKNLVWSHYLVSKDGDASNILLVRAGTTRIFTDRDGSSDAQATFDFLPKQIQNAVTKTLAGSISAAK
ncbi:hypothetical protein [Mucilaginibacter paludis]|nr:hypothetical protein [Mucilaginibacter paludis]